MGLGVSNGERPKNFKSNRYVLVLGISNGLTEHVRTCVLHAGTRITKGIFPRGAKNAVIGLELPAVDAAEEGLIVLLSKGCLRSVSALGRCALRFFVRLARDG